MKKVVLIIFSAILVICISVAGAFAFLTTKTEPIINEFTIGNIAIKLIEPEWDALPDENKNNIPDKAEHLSPDETIVKDPTVKNVGTNAAFVYIRVSVPKKAVKYMDNSGRIIEGDEKNPVELFTYKTNANWTEFAVDSSDDYNDYFYYYNTYLDPNEFTDSLFDSVHFIDVIEGQIEDKYYDIPVTAYGVQYSDGETQKTAWNQIANEKGLPICEVSP